MKSLKILIASLALVPAMAQALPIIALPTDTAGPFRHNVFHDASAPGAGGANGARLGWFDLDTSLASSWDPTSGAVNLNINIFTDSTLTTLIGTANGVGSLAGSDFNAFDDSLIGSITWTFANGAEGVFGAGPLTMEFYDHNYASDSSGNLANSYAGNAVTLWGADGTSTGDGYFTGATLGVDMVWQVPEPAVVLLFGLGLVALGLSRRRS